MDGSHYARVSRQNKNVAKKKKIADNFTIHGCVCMYGYTCIWVG